MKKKVIFLLFVCLIIQKQYTQQRENIPILEEQFKVTYNILGIEAAYEFPLSSKFTLDLGLGIGAGYYVNRVGRNTNEFGSSLSFDDFPPLRLKSKLKYIYNREKRFQKNKNLDNNSGNYFALQFLFSNSQNVTNIGNPPNDVLLTEFTWGFQRSLGGKWLIDINLGLGFAQDFDSRLTHFYPGGGLSFTYILN
ncbi:hypothetical protein [Polaribacter marinivivus]|uniref:hypothetical protein n=1 Tax=Polaribacter marinivivus TaxID=1524260 RepID=UPI003D347415